MGTRGKKTKAAFKVTEPPRVLSASQGARGPEGSARRLKRGSQDESREGKKEETRTGRLLCTGAARPAGRRGERMAVDVASSFVWQLGE